MRELRVSQATEVDHITNRAQGGTDEAHNLEGICVPCHKRKTAREAKAARHI
jgi:5-methylcytosine-specific restriction protein A